MLVPDASSRRGRYVLGELLGRGGMAEVFAGRAIGGFGFEKPVAIKRLLPELGSDAVFVERLVGEAKLLVGMQHGNIVSVLDLARDGDDVFLVMEFVDGPTLRQLIRAHGARGLPLGIATLIVQAAASGLEFAHARPGGAVIHADISPSNILLTTSGEVRVADFGIARREGITDGTVEGKWAYMAPEQARGEQLTPCSDVFALGVVLYELLCGKHPLGARITAGERESGPIRVIRPREVRADVPDILDAICMKALADAPRDRYARMQHLLDDLVEARFECGWREGASDLAALVRGCAPGPIDHSIEHPKTEITGRPVTIATRSLILDPSRASSPDVMSSAPEIDSNAVRLLAAAWSLRAPAPSQPADELRRAELASVHGGAIAGAGSGATATPDTRDRRWPFVLLGLAAVAGASGAVALELLNGSERPASARRHAAVVSATPRTEEARPAMTRPEGPGLDAAGPFAPRPVQTPTVAEPVPDEATPVAAPLRDVPVTIVAREKPASTPRLRGRPARHTRASSTASASSADVMLRVDTYDGNWAQVTIDSELRDTPGARFSLSPGTYTAKIRTDHARFNCRIRLERGLPRTVKISLEDRACD